VYAAASLLGDKGLQLISIYRELQQCRWVTIPMGHVRHSTRKCGCVALFGPAAMAFQLPVA
jgi:hypothetical protein